MNGKLYGIGVGPGAPDLLTLRAVKVLGVVDVILAAASPRNDYSTALETARPHLRPDVDIVRLEFPMTRDREILHDAWHKAADRTAQVLAAGQSAAFLTLGDPLIYSTFSYLARALRLQAQKLETRVEIEVIPGITSFQAAAARTQTVLCEGTETLLILPGINTGKSLEEGLKFADSSVILKAYKNFSAIRAALHSTGCEEKAVFVSKVCLEGELVCRYGESIPEVPPYLSLVLARR